MIKLTGCVEVILSVGIVVFTAILNIDDDDDCILNDYYCHGLAIKWLHGTS